MADTQTQPADTPSPEPAPAAPADVPEIELDEAVGLLTNPKVSVVNVLPRASHLEGHIPGTSSVPLAHLAQEAPTLWPDLERRIVVYCAGFT
jgi:rhodanese-related sulfurtransferase